MNWLGVILKVALEFGKAFTGFGGAMPVTGSNVPVGTTIAKVTDDFTRIVNAVHAGLTIIAALNIQDKGQTYAATAVNVAQVLYDSEVMMGHKIMDPLLFKQACVLYTQATETLLSSFEGK